jgi:hypothetical protein
VHVDIRRQPLTFVTINRCASLSRYYAGQLESVNGSRPAKTRYYLLRREAFGNQRSGATTRCNCSGHAAVEGIHGLPRSALCSSVAARRPFLRMVEM